MIEVTNDLFGIARRLQKINPSYRVYYNNRHQRFEIHASKALAFIVPYQRLDARTLEYALKTRVQNADYIEQEMNTHNKKILDSVNQNVDQAAVELQDMLKYAHRTGHNVAFTKNYIKEF